MSNHAPYIRQPASVRSIMLKVLAALLPGIAAYVWWFGAGVLVQIALASAAALAGEAAMLALRRKPLWLFLGDGSALVTAWLIALCFPADGPWWLVVAAALFAIVAVKHFFGGLGRNAFNPAMAAYCLMLVVTPQWMSESQSPVAGQEWQWVALGYLLGGLWLIRQRVITWHIPTAFLVALTAIAGGFHVFNPAAYAGVEFYLLSNSAMLGAFFIATDPVTGATTPRGKLFYAGGIAVLTWSIREFDIYPDGIALATLLMNSCAPLIDRCTQPPVFGNKIEPPAA
ncbi:MAG: RnfABCDGE type electron transport complex subunit D [Betaproteobacteria bacterium]|nr:RnfABCDGE type electron transport complex subunit D [Betaproteobacteria bacterium]